MRGMGTVSKLGIVCMVMALGVCLGEGNRGVVGLAAEGLSPQHGLIRGGSPTPGETTSFAQLSSPYHYTPGNRRDPFLLPNPSDAANWEEDQHSQSTTSQTQPMRLLGIVSGTRGYQAMIQTGHEKGTIVEAGTMLEPSRELVKAITDTAVIMAVPYIDEQGKRRMREKILRLPE